MSNYSCYVFTLFYQHRHLLQKSYIASSVLLGLQIIPTVIFNISILLVIRKTPSLHTPSYIFLFNLALSDLAVAIIGSPSIISTFMFYAFEMNPQMVCNSMLSPGFLSSMFSIVSFLTITAATVDRYLAVELHLKYATYVTTTRVAGVCILIWLGTAVFCFIGSYSIKIFTAVVFVSLVFCLFLMIFCYYKLYVVICRHRNRIQCQQNLSQTINTPSQAILRLRNTTYNIFFVFVLNILLYSPVVFGLIAFHFGKTSTVHALRFFVLIFPFLLANSTLDPLLYCWRLSDIRQALKQKWRQLRARIS